MRKSHEPADPPDDGVLVERARGDDKEAFAELMSRYERPLENILMSFTRDRNLARDLVQDAVLRAYQNLHRYREEHRFSTWFFKIGVNLAITAKRRMAYEQKARDPKEPGGPATRREQPETPFEALLRQDDLAGLRRALASLPERYREILHLRYGMELACKDIAVRLKTTANTISIILFRAKQRLKEHLEGLES